MSRNVLAIAALIAGVGVTPVSAQQTFEDSTQVITVEVPVHVVSDGEPVRGLTADDFEIVDGRKKRAITGFDVVDLAEVGDRVATPGEAAPPVPLVARRHFLFLFDLTFSEPASIARARHAALDIVDSQLHSTDLVGVAVYSLQEGTDVLLSFTSDRAQVRTAIETLGLSRLVNQIRDPLRLLMGDLGTGGVGDGSGGDQGIAGGGMADAMIVEQLRDVSLGMERENREQARGRVLAWTRGVQDLADLMASIEGRKHVVYLSEGVDGTAILGTENRERSAQMSAAVNNNEAWRVDSLERYGDTSSLQAVEQMYDAFRRADATVQAVQVGGGEATGGFGTAQSGRNQMLFMMADSTGGEFYQNFNQVEEAMGQMLDRTSVTYVLAFQPEDLEFDGSFHKLKVKLKNASRGTRVVHRPGYYAPKPFETTTVEERRLGASEMILGGREGGTIDTAVLAAPFRFEPDASYVPVLIEISGSSLLASGQDELVLELYGYAIDSGGRVRDFFSQTMGLDTNKIRPVLESTGVKFFGSFDLPPGEYALRILVRDARVGLTGLQAVSVRVPEPTAEIEALGPFFPEPLGRWLMVREAAGEEQERGVPYPFMLGQDPFVPAARAAMNGDAVSLAVLAYDVGEAAVDIEVSIVDAEGRSVGSPTIEGLQQAPAAMAGLTSLSATLHPGPLPPGEYELVVTVRGEAGRQTTSSSPFVVNG